MKVAAAKDGAVVVLAGCVYYYKHQQNQQRKKIRKGLTPEHTGEYTSCSDGGQAQY